MKLLFSGTISAPLLLAILIALSAFTLVIYRRHDLPRPWKYWLPGARICVFALLLLALLQPVLARFRSVTRRGCIPVVLDNSGSMQVADRYPLCRQVEIAWRMKLFPRKLRNTEFMEKEEEWAALSKAMAAGGAAAEEIGLLLGAGRTRENDVRRAVRDFAGLLEDAEARMKKIGGDLDDSVKKTDYLKPAKPEEFGRISYRRYDGIPGSRIEEMTGAPAYPDRPSQEGALNELATPRNMGDNYGAVLRGYLLPPETGSYEFTLDADDSAILFLSRDPDPERKRRVAWTNETASGSRSVRLETGEVYYVEAVLKESTGGDVMRVGWRRPGGETQAVVPGCFLAAFVPGGGPVFGLKMEQLSGSLARTARIMQDTAKAAKETESLPAGRNEKIESLLSDYSMAAADVNGLAGMLKRLQETADERLALAGIKEVDDALAKLNRMKREELARFLLTEDPYDMVKRLSRKGDADVFTLGDNLEPLRPSEYTNVVCDLAATKIGSTIRAILNRYEKRKIAAVLLLSDGNNNAGTPAHTLRGILKERGVPLFSLAIGSADPPPDVAIARVLSPTTSFAEDRVALNVVLKREAFQDRPIRLQVKCDDTVLKESTVEPGPEETILADMSFEEPKSGLRNYTVTAEGFPGEAFAHNNAKSITVNVLQDRIKTVLVDEYPRWESRYANMMLTRDKRVDLRTVFIGSTKLNALPLGKDGFPANRDELFAQHILILGDVNPGHFTTNQMADIRDFVRQRGGTVILLSGEHYMPTRYAGTPIEELIPLKRLDAGPRRKKNVLPADTANSPSKGSFRLSLTQASRYEDVLQIGGTPEETERLWERLPGMNWVREGASATVAAETLAIASPDPMSQPALSGPAGDSPVLIKAYFGSGKILYLGADSFWRWRYRARWTYHHRFWGQILLWATMGRTTGSDRFVKIMSDRIAYAPEETIAVKARLLDEDGLPLANADAAIEVFDEKKALVKRLPLLYLDDSGGEYRAQIRELPKGRYRVVPKVHGIPEERTSAETSFEIRDLPTSEYIDLVLNETHLEELSDKAFPFERALDAIKEVRKIETTEELHDDIELWDTFPYAILVASLLGFEWWGRKRQKLL